MKQTEIQSLVQNQTQFFKTRKTWSTAYRKQSLLNLKSAIEKYEKEVYEALSADLGKTKSESYMTEVGMVYSELNYMLHHFKKYAKKKKVHTPLAQFHAVSYIQPCPKGNVLIMSPWNYPFLLTMEPLIDALAAGNTAIIKPSAYAPATSKIIETIIRSVFSSEYVAVVSGGRKENQALLEQKFNHIFFTGSHAVGKEVLKKASEYFTTVTLELGGKSPCIIEKSANIDLAAKRIVFGKLLNCGQTCVAPDYIYCDESIADAFISALKKEYDKQYEGKGKIINEKHYNRLKNLLNSSPLYYGGKCNDETLQIEPAIMKANQNSEIMQDEIFGPILPVMTYKDVSEVKEFILSRSCPLALYIFSNNKTVIEEITTEIPYGGGCINDTIIHLASSQMGFGGCQESGMGSYHGKAGFDTFSHYKSIVDKKNWIDLPIRYQPYTDLKDRLIHIFMK